jgi:hypothetical protein
MQVIHRGGEMRLAHDFHALGSFPRSNDIKQGIK